VVGGEGGPAGRQKWWVTGRAARACGSGPGAPPGAGDAASLAMEFCGGSGDGIQKNRSEEKEAEPYKQVEPSRAREGKEPKEEVSRLLCTPSDWSGTASGQGAHEKLPAPGAHPIFFRKIRGTGRFSIW